ncbi:hypothetical protein H4R20_000938 [Coemansia guatemalensis]|uniref:Myb-like domain-containing protein n=1 Tax=Coemansia guatemalensis TaxID=2761395 RepID=A0A9W8I6T4_9FUNG|nr:hypothetical protein H4R20_000938 [Coemansia guatemalensis]
MVGHEAPGTFSTAAAAAAVAAAAAAAAGTPISNSTHWSNEETKLLIKTWGEHREDFAEIKRNLSVWNRVLERLLKAGFFRSVEQCRNRWKFLETKYKAALKEFDNTGRTTWEFFEDMDEAKYGPSLNEAGGRVRRNSSAQASDSASERQATTWTSRSMYNDAPGRVQLPSIRATPAFAAAAAQVSSSGQNASPQKIEIAKGRSVSPLEYAPAAYGHDISAGRSSLPRSHAADVTSAMQSYGNPQHTLSLDGLSTAAAAAGDSRDNLRVLAAKRQFDLSPAGRVQSAGELATATVAAMSKQNIDALSRQQSSPTTNQQQKKNSTARKRKLEQDGNSIPEENTTEAAKHPPLQSLEALESDKIELVGEVRRTDVLDFLRTQATLRSQRTAEWAEERRRAEEQRCAEEWRFHEFQMAMVRLIQNSLAPYAVDSDGIAESPRSARTDKQSKALSPNARHRAGSDPGGSHHSPASAAGSTAGAGGPEDGEIDMHTSALLSIGRGTSKEESNSRSMSIESNATSHSSWGMQTRA